MLKVDRLVNNILSFKGTLMFTTVQATVISSEPGILLSDRRKKNTETVFEKYA